MAFEEWVDRIWQQIGLLDAEHELLECELERIRTFQGDSSREAEKLTQQLDEMEKQLLRLDEQYSALLKRGGWMDV